MKQIPFLAEDTQRILNIGENLIHLCTKYGMADSSQPIVEAIQALAIIYRELWQHYFKSSIKDSDAENCLRSLEEFLENRKTTESLISHIDGLIDALQMKTVDQSNCGIKIIDSEENVWLDDLHPGRQYGFVMNTHEPKTIYLLNKLDISSKITPFILSEEAFSSLSRELGQPFTADIPALSSSQLEMLRSITGPINVVDADDPAIMRGLKVQVKNLRSRATTIFDKVTKCVEQAKSEQTPSSGITFRK